MNMDSDMKVTLHYFPGSFYSHRVLLALYEKGVNFDEHIINILTGGQFHPDFLKANNKGRVPVLEINGEFYSESEHIIDVIDKKFISGPKLVPDVGSSFGDAVRDFREFLYDVRIDLVTYGVIANRKFMKDTSNLRFIPPSFTKDGIKKKFLGEVDKLRAIRATCDPSLYEAIDEKIKVAFTRSVEFIDEDLVRNTLDDLESVFDKINERLAQTKRENPDTPETWLMGSTYTAADISAFTLFYRMEYVGLAPRYFSDTVRPRISEYYSRLMSRPSTMKLVEKMNEMKRQFMMARLKAVGLKVLKIGFVFGLIGVGYMGYKSLSRGSKSS